MPQTIRGVGKSHPERDKTDASIGINGSVLGPVSLLKRNSDEHSGLYVICSFIEPKHHSEGDPKSFGQD